MYWNENSNINKIYSLSLNFFLNKLFIDNVMFSFQMLDGLVL